MSTLSRRTITVNKSPAFCEIFVQGYGNGLNEAIISNSSPSTSPTDSSSDDENVLVSRESSSASASSAYTARSGSSNPSDTVPDMDHLSVSGEDSKPAPPLSAPTSKSMSDAKSKRCQSAAGSVRRARMSVPGAEDLYYRIDSNIQAPKTKALWKPGMVLDETNQLKGVHFNTRTWDAFLKV
jgi:hypothetical protein